MWKGANNIAVVALLLGGIACTDKNNDGASSLLDEAKSSVSIADYSRAITLLDSIHKAFPDAFDQRQEAYSLRNEVDYKKTIADKQLTDSLLVDEQIRLDSILHYFKKVDSPELFRPYFIYKSLPAGSIILRSGIEPRVTVLGYIQRGGAPSGRDRVSASMMGVRAVEVLCREDPASRVIVARNGRFEDMDIEEALKMECKLDEEMYNACFTINTSYHDHRR